MAYDAEAELSTADKLELLADALEDVPEEQFDVRFWWNKHYTKTCGCIVGWGIRKQGERFGLKLMEVLKDGPIMPATIDESGKGWDAVCSAFGLELHQALVVFCEASVMDESAKLYGARYPTRAQAQVGLRRYAAELRAAAPVRVLELA